MCLGQAAGVAAAIAVEKDIALRSVPYPALRERLIRQGVLLP